MKTRYNIRINSVGFEEEEEYQVWLNNLNYRRSHSPKLQDIREGRYSMWKRINAVVYRIQREEKRKFKLVCVDHHLDHRVA